MKIEKIKYKGIEFQYPLSDYLYPYLFRYAVRNKIDIWTNGTLTVEEDSYSEFVQILESCIRNLLGEFYEEPSHKKRSKFSSRYIKVFLDDKKYAVDYRTDPVGKVIFKINDVLQWIKKAQEA